MDVEELSAGMGPARRLDDPPALVEAVEPGIAVCLQHAGEGCKVRDRTLALAVGRCEEHGPVRTLAAMRALVANVGPEPACLGLARAWGEHRDRRVVAVHHAR